MKPDDDEEGVCVGFWTAGTMLRLYRNGMDAGPLTGAELTIPTSPGEVLHIAPDGTSYASILSKMRTGL